MNLIPQKSDLIEAHKRIETFIHKTPILSSRSINQIYTSTLFFKCENFQKVGAFKMRGASNAILKLSDSDLKKGVATHSSGNHAAALSLAARMKGVRAQIVMPVNAPAIKRRAVENYGGKIIECLPTQKSREETLEKVIRETGATFIHPYNNYNIIEGQATCAMEVYNELSDLDFIIAPVGGGGLISGTCLATQYFSPKTKVVGAEPKGADDAFRSIRDGVIYPSINPQTVADGLRTSLCEKTFQIIAKYVSEIITVEENSIISAMRIIWERMKIIIEPSAAVTLAVIIENQSRFIGKKVGLILSGGNLDLDHLPWY